MIHNESVMRHMRIRNVPSFAIRWSDKPCYSYFAQRQIDEGKTGPLYTVTQRKYDARPQSLWWFVNASIAEGGKNKVVRAWLQRRVRLAVTTALQARGFDKDGVRQGNQDECLKGSALFSVQKACLTRKWDDLKQDANLAVDFLVEKTGTRRAPTIQELSNARNQYEPRPHGRLRPDTTKRTKDEEGPSTSGTTSRSIFHKNPRLPRG